jgi:homoserine dehydrogenase
VQTEGSDFDTVLADAQRLGYAEADPTADVDGFDAADKIAILASLAFGGRIKLDEVHREGIRQITAADIAYADKLGFVIKLLATAQRDATVDETAAQPDRLQVRVHPTLVVKTHPLASINGVYNAVLIEGDPIGQVMFFGPGAGSGPTASAIVSDMLNIAAILTVERGSGVPSNGKPLDPLLACSHQHYCTITPIDELVTRFYVRVLAQDSPGVIGKLGTCFGNHDVSLESIVQIGLRDNRAEIVVITHHVREGNFRQALEEIIAFEDIATVSSVLRVL